MQLITQTHRSFIRVWFFISLIFLSIKTVHSEEVFQEIVINPGDTLWAIANKYLKDPRRWPDIIKYNNLPDADPTVALPGSKIKVPVLLIKEEFRNAQLIKFIPEVRIKRKGATEWNEAIADQTLHYEDSLRTMKGGQAQVKFPSKEVVQINENTYVVLKPEKILQQIDLLKGEVRASKARVIMPNGTVVKPLGEKTDYQAKVREDKTEVVFVYKGKVDVTARGKTVTVREGFGTQVPEFSPPSEPLPLTSFKDFNPAELTSSVLPPSSANGKSRVIPPSGSIDPIEDKRSKAISSKEILVNYSLVLANDEKFLDVVFETTEEIGSKFNIKKSKIKDGTYFMKVAFTDALGVKGPYSEPSLIVKDTVAPYISNLLPTEGQTYSGDESYCDVIGEVTGATLLAVNGEVIFIDSSGKFNKFLSLSDGKNKISVVARDAHGNETIVTRTVTYSAKKGR